ncbi:MAG: helix-turn-helix domain-containing protein [Propionibacteriaceae bacterium]|jgi:transcriptional regulator with XRE-family HTH domain|nr:helix-turn-helix domain-containing protein [Propionibacteriaceae bacterium]
MPTYSGPVQDAETLGQFVAQARLLKGMSQRDLAAEMGVSQRYVWDLESGEPTIWARRLFAAMRATGMTLTATIGTDDTRG